MSNHLAVATVTRALRDLVQQAVNAAELNATVTTQRPAAATGDGATSTRVNVYLYQVTHNPYLGNNDLPTRRGDGARVDRPQVALNLHYLLSFYGNETECEPEQLLGTVISALHAQPQLDRATLRALVQKTDSLKTSDLADQVELVKFTPLGLNLEEFSKLWSVFFQTTYTLSVAYAASVVLIAAGELPEMAKPVAAPTLWLRSAVAQPGGQALQPTPPADVATLAGSEPRPVAAGVLAAQPGALADLQLWLRADVGIEYDQQALLAVWSDQSGKHNDAKQDKQEAKPLFMRNVLNGSPVLHFDGQDDHLAVDRFFYAVPAAADGLTLFALVRSSSQQRQILVSYDADEYWSVALADASGRLSWQTRAADPGARQDLATDQPCADGAWHLVCVWFGAGADRDKQIFVDGRQVAMANAHNGAKIGTGVQRYGFIGVGSNAAALDGQLWPLEFFKGDLAELVFYSRALAPAERQQIEEYFIEKYT